MRAAQNDQKFYEVSFDTFIEDSDGDQHPVTLFYARWANTNVITDHKITFKEEKKFSGFVFIDEIVQEIIEGLEGTRNLVFNSQIVIE